MKTMRYTQSLALFVVCASILYFVNLVVTPEIVGPNNLETFFRPTGKRQFDSLFWKSSSDRSGKRYEMADALLSRRTLIGLSIADVKELLGNPDIADLDRSDPQFIYYLGRQKDYPARSLLFPGTFPNHEVWMLKIVFEKGKVYSVKIFFT